MKLKTSELTGAALDWAAAVAEGRHVVVLTVAEQEARWFEDVEPEKLEKARADFDTYIRGTLNPEIRLLGDEGYKRYPTHQEAPMPYGAGIPRFQYSTSWLQVGPIIERERITLRVNTTPGSRWVAFLDSAAIGHYPHRQHGPTPLIAAMRCYVASKLGDEVEIPEELCPCPTPSTACWSVQPRTTTTARPT